MDQSIKFQKQMYEEGKGFLAPYHEEGLKALEGLAADVKAGPGEFVEDPGYQFRLAEGQKALERSAAARGNLLSGEQMKAQQRYGQEYATGEYENFLSRHYKDLAARASIAGMGQQAAANVMSGGQAAAGNVGNVLSQLGTASAQAARDKWMPWAQAAGQIGQYGMNALSLYGNQPKPPPRTWSV